MKIACVLDSGYEDSEFQRPYYAWKQQGHDVTVIGFKGGTTLHGKKGESSTVSDMGIADANIDNFDALFVPGGNSPDHLRADSAFVEFTRAFAQADKPIVAICHGPQLLATADAIKGRRLTAWKTIQDDLRRMGEDVVDEEVVVDRRLVTSRQPSDIDAFIREGAHVLEGAAAK